MKKDSFNFRDLVVAIVALSISLEVLTSLLPRLLLPIVVLAAVVAVLRLVFFHTRRW